MLLHVKEDFWDVKEIKDLQGVDFFTAARFTDLKANEVYIFPLVSDQNDIWQVGEKEFVLLSGHEIFHIGFTKGKGVEIFFRQPAEFCKSLFDGAFFYFEDVMEISHIYSLIDRLEIKNIIKNAIGPEVNVVIEKPTSDNPLLIRLEIAHVTARFLLRGPVEDVSLLGVGNSVVESDRQPEDLMLCLGFYDSSVKSVRNFEDFSKLAKEGCRELKIAEYYERCGGYLIEDRMVRGIFTQKLYTDSVKYEFSPDDFFNRVAIPKLLAANGLVEVAPKKPCAFLGESIDNSEYSIGLSHDILIIVEHTGTGNKTYALEMYDQACLGLRQVGKNTFLAITSVFPGEPDVGFAQLRHFTKNGAAGNFVWDDFTISLDGKSYVSTAFCQLTDDIILFEKEPESHSGNHHLDMWSISKDRLVNLTNTFYDLYWPKNNSHIAHSEKQILVKPIGKKYVSKEPQIMLAVRLYRPKAYCDVFALINPQTKYRIYGKVYNMLADSMTAKPRVANDLVKLLDENEALKESASEHLSGTLK